jgi:O-antigen/teichoic acid export membrane protein
LNLPLFLVVLLFPTQILAIFGRSFVGGVTALTILAWRNLAVAGTGIGGVMIDMTGNTRLKVVNTIVVSTLVVSLNFLLIPRWGLIGAAVAALTVAVVGNLMPLLEVFILFRLLPHNAGFLKPVTAGLVALAASLVTGRFLPPEASLIYVIIDLGILLSVYVGMVLLLGLTEEDRMVVDRLRGRAGAMLSRR